MRGAGQGLARFAPWVTIPKAPFLKGISSLLPEINARFGTGLVSAASQSVELQSWGNGAMLSWDEELREQLSLGQVDKPISQTPLPEAEPSGTRPCRAGRAGCWINRGWRGETCPELSPGDKIPGGDAGLGSGALSTVPTWNASGKWLQVPPLCPPGCHHPSPVPGQVFLLSPGSGRAAVLATARGGE